MCFPITLHYFIRLSKHLQVLVAFRSSMKLYLVQDYAIISEYTPFPASGSVSTPFTNSLDTARLAKVPERMHFGMFGRIECR